MHTHLEESLERDISRIRNQVTEMAKLAEKALQDCVKALVENNRQLAYAVILRDQYINEKEKEIDRLCLEFLVRQQPVARPLRFAYTTIRINLELERVGDYAESIAHNILRLENRAPAEIKQGILELAKLAITMYQDATQSLFEQNADLARATFGVEEAVNAMRNKLNNNIVREFQEQKIPFDVFDPLMTLVRRFERVSDQARNICMEAIYMVTGEVAKHPASQAFRILFVDNHNSCRGQMAEAIASGLNQPRFIFSSAGLEPKPVDARTIEYMKEKGFNLERTAPKSIYQIPNLEYYQVIIILSKEVHKALPQSPRKVVLLDWNIEDPSLVQGPSEKVRASYDAAFQFINSHIVDLVQAILGTETR